MGPLVVAGIDSIIAGQKKPVPDSFTSLGVQFLQVGDKLFLSSPASNDQVTCLHDQCRRFRWQLLVGCRGIGTGGSPRRESYYLRLWLSWMLSFGLHPTDSSAWRNSFASLIGW